MRLVITQIHEDHVKESDWAARKKWRLLCPQVRRTCRPYSRTTTRSPFEFPVFDLSSTNSSARCRINLERESVCFVSRYVGLFVLVADPRPSFSYRDPPLLMDPPYGLYSCDLSSPLYSPSSEWESGLPCQQICQTCHLTYPRGFPSSSGISLLPQFSWFVCAGNDSILAAKTCLFLSRQRLFKTC